jgi:Zn-dependent protease with chaperone function
MGIEKISDALPDRITDELHLNEGGVVTYEHKILGGIFRKKFRLELETKPPNSHFCETTYVSVGSFVSLLILTWFGITIGAFVTEIIIDIFPFPSSVPLVIVALAITIFCFWSTVRLYKSEGSLLEIEKLEGSSTDVTAEHGALTMVFIIVATTGMIALYSNSYWMFGLVSAASIITVKMYVPRWAVPDDEVSPSQSEQSDYHIESPNSTHRNNKKEEDNPGQMRWIGNITLQFLPLKDQSIFFLGYYKILIYGSGLIVANSVFFTVATAGNVLATKVIGLSGMILFGLTAWYLIYRNLQQGWDYIRPSLTNSQGEIQGETASQDITTSIPRILYESGFLIFVSIIFHSFVLLWTLLVVFIGIEVKFTIFLMSTALLTLVIPSYLFFGGLVQIYRLILEHLILWKYSSEQVALYPDEISAPIRVIQTDDAFVGCKYVGFRPQIVISEGLKTKLEQKEGALKAVLAHEDAHIRNGDLRLILVIQILSALFFIPKNVFFVKFDFRDREWRADRYAKNVSGTNLKEAIDITSDVKAKQQLIGPAFVSFLPHPDIDMSVLTKMFSIYYGNFGLTKIHPSNEERRANI